MESVANAVSVAVSAASAALEVSSDAVAPLWSQLELLVSAAFQVTQAFWLLIGYAFSLLTQKLFTQPLWATVLISVPSVWSRGGSGRSRPSSNSWSASLRGSQTSRTTRLSRMPQHEARLRASTERWHPFCRKSNALLAVAVACS